MIKYDDEISVLYRRCLHRGAFVADSFVESNTLICGLHGWDYRYDTGVPEYNQEDGLHKVFSEQREGWLWIDKNKIDACLLETSATGSLWNLWPGSSPTSLKLPPT